MRARIVAVGLVLVALQLTSVFCAGQSSTGLPLPNASGQVRDPDQEKRDREIAKKANQERQAQLRSDTARLLKLATELNDYVD